MYGMNNKDMPDWCRKAADSILHDLSGRLHIRCVLDIIDEDAMEEIKETMAGIIMQESALAEMEKRS